MVSELVTRSHRRGSLSRAEQDERVEQLVELAPDAILIHQDGKIVLANAAAVRLAGATRRSQVVGRRIEDFLDPPYLKAVESQITDAIAPAEIAQAVRDSFRRLDGTSVEVEVRAMMFMERGRPSAHLVIRDVTDSLAAAEAARVAQDHLQDVQRMESVGALAGGVAHEVNNKLQVVLAFSDFLLRDSSLSPKALADVREVVRAADRAAAVVRQLLAFSRRAVHRPREMDLGSCVRGIDTAIRHLLGSSRQLAMVAEAPTRVWADCEQLEQVVINLVLNARDSMPNGGRLTLTTTEVELEESVPAAGGLSIPPGRYATLSAEDTGSGIDQAVLSHIFEPFFTTKPNGMGTGLGLAAAHGVMTQNHGFITVESMPGEGTKFTLYVPLRANAQGIDPHAPTMSLGVVAVPRAATVSHAGALILVVDDEPAVLGVAKRILESGGFQVRQALDGADALQIVDGEGPPQLVLTDFLMRRMGGAELARQLNQRWPSLPVIFMSGYSAEELYRQGAIGSSTVLLQKPFSPAELLSVVASALTRVDTNAK